MFNSGILDVAIGIVFVYLLVSLIVSAANELLAAIFKMRGRVLWQGIRNLLPTGEGKQNIAQQVYEHPLITGLSPSARPSYIPSRTFALALLDVISGSTGQIASRRQLPAKIDLLPANLRRSLHLLLSESQNDLECFKANVEVWFNDSMDRVSGVYKRKVHYALFFLGFVLSVALNVDTIVLANRLSRDSALRAALVSSATATAHEPAPANAAGEGRSVPEAETNLAETIKDLDQLRLPIGWAGPDPDLTPHFATLGFFGGLGDAARRHFLGWLLTAFATTLGAPFWFDLLNRFINIRSAGKAPEEKPKDPKEVPLPVGPGAHPRASSPIGQEEKA